MNSSRKVGSDVSTVFACVGFEEGENWFCVLKVQYPFSARTSFSTLKLPAPLLLLLLLLLTSRDAVASSTASLRAPPRPGNIQ